MPLSGYMEVLVERTVCLNDLTIVVVLRFYTKNSGKQIYKRAYNRRTVARFVSLNRTEPPDCFMNKARS